MSLVSVLLVVAGICWILGRRMAGQQVELKGLLVLPVVLTIVGATQLGHVHGMNATAVAFVVVSAVISVALGVWRGRTVHLGVRGGQLWMRYRPVTVGLWVLNLALKVLLLPVEHAVSHSAAGAAEHGIMVSLGLGILAETAVVVLRALSTPRANVVWSRGKDGAPDRPSPAFDAARARVQEHGGVRAAATGARNRMVSRDW